MLGSCEVDVITLSPILLMRKLRQHHWIQSRQHLLKQTGRQIWPRDEILAFREVTVPWGGR